MNHFGTLVRKLRESRGWSQRQLADASGTSEATIQRGELEATCVWRRSTSTDVFSALHRRSPMTEHEQSHYAQLTGLDAIARAASPLLPASSHDGISVLDDDERFAHECVHHLISSRGVKNVMTALEGIAAAWGANLPSRDRTSHNWAVVTDEIYENVRVRTYTPATKKTVSTGRLKKSG